MPNCDPAYLASIVDPTELANAALACGGGGGTVAPLPNETTAMQTSVLGDAYDAIQSGAQSVVHAAADGLDWATKNIGKDLGNLLSGKVILVLVLVAVVAVVVMKGKL